MFAWALLALLILQFIAALVWRESSSAFLAPGTFIAVLATFIAVAVLYALLAFRLRCPQCARRFLVETLGPKHRDARTCLGMDHWATAVVDVLRHGQCVCMYCGTRINVVAHGRAI